MKKLLILTLSLFILTSCAAKKVTTETSIKKIESLEGEKIKQATTKIKGIEMVESLSEDGTKIEKVPYVWFAGTNKSNDKQTAIEFAQREAYATISRTLNQAVNDNASRGTLGNDGVVEKALKSYWEQVSISISRGCEPFGDVIIEYSPSTRMYDVTAKVGIRGDRYQQLINEAGSYRPDNLTKEQLDDFIERNKAIMEAAEQI